MDTCKIAPGLYQYTSVDDYTRYGVLRLHGRRTAANTLDFIDAVVEEMPFPIQRFQTDRGKEFFAEKVQKKMMSLGTNSALINQLHHISMERLSDLRKPTKLNFMQL